MSHGPQEPLKPLVARKLSRKAEKLLVDGNARVAAVAARPDLYPSPNPPSAQCQANLDKLGACIKAAKGAGPVARAAVKAAAQVVTTDQTLLAAFVQSQADAATPEQAVVIITTALFDVRKPTTRSPKSAISAKHGPTSGTARIDIAAIAKALLYFVETSGDGKSWSKAVDTQKVTAIVSGLTPGQTCYFRFRAFVRGSGYTDYSQTVSLMVL